MKCIICPKEIPEGRDRKYKAKTCSPECSLKYKYRYTKERLVKNMQDYYKKINNRCPFCNKLITPKAKTCLNHRTKLRIHIKKIGEGSFK
jgi:predicted nucleic acid-binding Zn ribbon protein